MDIESLRTSYDEAAKYGFKLKEEFISKVLDPNSYSNDDKNVTNGTNGNDGTVIKKIPVKETFATVKKRLLEMDLRQHMKPYFPLEINSSIDLLELPGPVILQIISVGNITQPLRRRDENTQPRMLSIQVSDGTTKVTGIEIEHLPDINANTPPGGKILFSGGTVRFGKLLFTPQNFKYIGGVVDHLLEAYQANKIVQKLRSIGINQNFRGLEGPPQFEIKLIGLKTNNQKIASIDESNQGVNKADNNKQKHDNTQKGNKQKNKVGKDINQSLPNTDASPTPLIQHEKESNDKNHTRFEGGKEHLHERGGRDGHGHRNSSRGRGRSDRGGGRSDRGGGRNDRGGGRSDRSDRGGGRSDRSDRGGGRSNRNDSSSRGFSHNTYPPAPPNETISFLENDFPALSINTKSKGSWVCSQCTFSNHEALQICEICNCNKNK